MQGPTAQQYLRILGFYSDALREPVDSGGHRFELVFEQVVRLVVLPSPFNDALPTPFLDVARRYSGGEAATVRHFSHDENRQFFLSDLHDYLLLQLARNREA